MQLLDQLEDRAGGPTRAAAVIGISYAGTYTAWKRTGKIPRQGIHSIEAHLALSDRAFQRLLEERAR